MNIFFLQLHKLNKLRKHKTQTFRRTGVLNQVKNKQLNEKRAKMKSIDLIRNNLQVFENKYTKSSISGNVAFA